MRFASHLYIIKLSIFLIDVELPTCELMDLEMLIHHLTIQPSPWIYIFMWSTILFVVRYLQPYLEKKSWLQLLQSLTSTPRITNANYSHHFYVYLKKEVKVYNNQ